MSHTTVISKMRCINPNKRNSIVRNKNHVNYIGTRDGVDLSPIEDFSSPEEDNAIHVKYINERPGSHGLFGNFDVSDINATSSYVADLTRQGRVIHQCILSLSEQDAVKLGYDHKKNWVSFMNKMMPEVAQIFHIPLESLQWCAAVHMEKNHPHCHYVFWNSKDEIRSPFIHISTQNKCRELFSKEFFKEEREQEIINRTLARDLMLDLGKELNSNIMESILNPDMPYIPGRFSSSAIEELSNRLINFSTQLPKTGRLNYSFLPHDTKLKLDRLVDFTLKQSPLNIVYNQYLEYVERISATASATEASTIVSLEKAKEDIHRRLGNQILKSCKELLEQGIHLQDFLDKTIPDNIFDIDEPEEKRYHLRWSEAYKEAKSLITLKEPSELETALELLQDEQAKNNVLAYEMLGKLYMEGKVLEADEAEANGNYAKALEGFQQCLNDPKYAKLYPYINYKLGKFYEKGLGTEINNDKAISYYRAASGNPYADYALGKMYKSGLVLEPITDNQLEINKQMKILFGRSANNGFSYAAYEYARLGESHPELRISPDEIQKNYVAAYQHFLKDAEQDDSGFLFYRLGTMTYNGKGREKNIDKAFDFFKSGAKKENAYSCYSLGKMYADPEYTQLDYNKAVEMFQKAISNGMTYSHISLGKIFADENTPYYNPVSALKEFQAVIKEYPETAYYQLAKVHLNENTSVYNFKTGFSFLERAARLGNPYALAKLGSLYLWGHDSDLKCNVELGKELLQKSIDTGNEYAQNTLNAYENYRLNLAVGLAYRLLMFSSQVISDNKKRTSDNYDSLVSKVCSKENLKDSKKKQEHTI